MMSDLDMEDMEVVADHEEVDVTSLERATEMPGRQSGEHDPLRISHQAQGSDIHIEPYERTFRVRYRIDGVLYERDEAAPEAEERHPPPASRSLPNWTSPSAPSPGRTHKDQAGREARTWISASRSLPTLFRREDRPAALDKSNLQLDMTKLGYEPRGPGQISKEAIHRAVRHGFW